MRSKQSPQRSPSTNQIPMILNQISEKSAIETLAKNFDNTMKTSLEEKKNVEEKKDKKVLSSPMKKRGRPKGSKNTTQKITIPFEKVSQDQVVIFTKPTKRLVTNKSISYQEEDSSSSPLKKKKKIQKVIVKKPIKIEMKESNFEKRKSNWFETMFDRVCGMFS